MIHDEGFVLLAFVVVAGSGVPIPVFFSASVAACYQQGNSQVVTYVGI